MSDSWKERPADAKLLLDSGLLFEINRSTLHLVGLALVVRKDEKGDLFLAVKDSRNSPEQATYSSESFTLGKSKLTKFMSEFGLDQLNRRRNLLGWGAQPEP